MFIDFENITRFILTRLREVVNRLPRNYRIIHQITWENGISVSCRYRPNIAEEYTRELMAKHVKMKINANFNKLESYRHNGFIFEFMDSQLTQLTFDQGYVFQRNLVEKTCRLAVEDVLEWYSRENPHYFSNCIQFLKFHHIKGRVMNLCYEGPVQWKKTR